MSRRDRNSDLDALPGLPREADGPVFREPWEAQAFAMAVELNRRGVFAWTEWTEALSHEIRKAGTHDAGADYYRHWLAALERLLESKGVLGQNERFERISAWDRAARATPHGEPIELGRGRR